MAIGYDMNSFDMNFFCFPKISITNTFGFNFIIIFPPGEKTPVIATIIEKITANLHNMKQLKEKLIEFTYLYK